MTIKDLIRDDIINNKQQDCIINEFDYELMLDVELDKKSNYVFNLNLLIDFEFDDSDVKWYVTDQDNLSWAILSYRLYDNTHFAWLLMDMNKANGKNLFYIPKAGTPIKFLDKKRLSNVISYLN